MGQPNLAVAPKEGEVAYDGTSNLTSVRRESFGNPRE